VGPVTSPYRSLALAALFAAGLSAADYATEGKLWWAHIEFLADDKLDGRNTGSPGFLKAVQYVESQFEKLGLEPAGGSPADLAARMAQDTARWAPIVKASGFRGD